MNMTSKEALERIKRSHNVAMACIGCKEEDTETLNAIGTIEKDLEILEIIRTHKLLNYVIKNKKCANMYHLTCEKLGLLEEWLKR